MEMAMAKHSIEEFSNDPRGYLRQLRERGEPETLAVDGQPVAVVLDVRA